jgi:hypothetical protein
MNKSTDITTRLPEILQQVDRLGNFATGGLFRFYSPGLVVEGIGPIALPLLPIQAEALIAAAQPAPYGRGEETLVDREVRRTWQVDAKQLRIEGEGWRESLVHLVGSIKQSLGVCGDVEAEIYKLLIYDAGSFFVEHRDTEKREGMFATLVITLPCDYEGGELVVRHQGEEMCFDLHADGVDQVGYAAFFADCKHEVRPVTAGYRLTLIYNLIRTGAGSLPKPADYSEEQQQASELLHDWAQAKQQGDEDLPEKLIYPLEHAYTPAEISFATLKNADAAVSAVLVAAAEQSDCEISLALVSLEEEGGAEHHGYYGYSGRRSWDETDEDDFEIIEVYDTTQKVGEWCKPDGSLPNLGELEFDEEELCPPDLFSSMDPTDLSFSEATGNEGASFERSYHIAALVLWPKGRTLAVVAHSAGLSTTLPLLADLVRQWQQAEGDASSAARSDALELARHIKQQWPKSEWENSGLSRQGDTANFLTSLSGLGAVETAVEFIERVIIAGAYTKADNEALVRVLEQMSEAGRSELLDRLFRKKAVTCIDACADLLRKLTHVDYFQDKSATLGDFPSMLTVALPDVARAEKKGYRRPSACVVSPQLVVDLVAGIDPIDPHSASIVVEWLLTGPQDIDMDDVLLPAALDLNKLDGNQVSASILHLIGTVREHLRQRIDEALESPADWSRPAKLTCHCSQCNDLSYFLANSMQSEWRYRAAQAKRSHMEATIRNSSCDIDYHTNKTGSPHTLVCRKNQNSYYSKGEQRKRDERDLAMLA